MKIPTKGKYAVSAMMDLAIHDSIKPLTIAEIAEKQNISLSYLEQLFAVLRKNGLVKGTRGPGGGYRLSRPAREITVAQILRTVDENTGRVKADQDMYQPYVHWDSLSEKMYEFLAGISLEDSIQQSQNRGKLAESSEAQIGNAELVAA